MTEQEAVEALQAAAAEDGLDSSQSRDFREAQAEVARERSGDTASEQADTSSETATDEGTTEEDSFLQRLDPNELPPELLPYYKSMQGDYTRTKQELAEQGRQFEALEQYGGVETATQALEWIAGLENPDNAKALYMDLRDALTERGIPLEEASQMAAEGVAEAQDDFGVDESDPRYSQLEQKFNQLEQAMAEREEREYQLYLKAELDRQEAEVIRNNPDYTDDDMEDIMKLAYATNADLLAAADVYNTIQQRTIGNYIDRKGKVANVTDLPATASSDEQERISDLNDPRLEKIVNRYLAEVQADELS